MTLSKGKFFKYLSVSEEEHRWGLFVTGAGYVQSEKNADYPSIDHPAHHYFKWSAGRKLNAYQILYITSGSGLFQSEFTDVQMIKPGDAIFLFPGVWHRYKPDSCNGWTEYWVEFNGDMIGYYMDKGFLDPSSPVIPTGLTEEIVGDFRKIIELVKDENPGFQYLTSGTLFHLIGQIFASRKQSSSVQTAIEKRISEARIFILENLNTKISQEEIARQVGLGYSLYRKKFREITGFSPASYQMQMRLNIARHLLLSSAKSVKEISANLGYESTDYFCKYFKQKTGMTPSEYREGKR